jgi:hypothetical protein
MSDASRSQFSHGCHCDRSPQARDWLQNNQSSAIGYAPPSLPVPYQRSRSCVSACWCDAATGSANHLSPWAIVPLIIRWVQTPHPTPCVSAPDTRAVVTGDTASPELSAMLHAGSADFAGTDRLPIERQEPLLSGCTGPCSSTSSFDLRGSIATCIAQARSERTLRHLIPPSQRISVPHVAYGVLPRIRALYPTRPTGRRPPGCARSSDGFG